MKKVLHLISPIGCFGAEKVMITLCVGLVSSEYQPLIGVIGNSTSSHFAVIEEAQRSGLDVIDFTCKGKFDINFVRTLTRFLRDKDIAIIHSHGYKSNFYALIASFKTKVRKIATCHNWLGESGKMKFYKQLDLLLLSRFDKLVVVSKTLRNEIIKKGISSNKVEIIHNGVDLDRYCLSCDRLVLKDSFKINDNEIIVGTVGRLSKEKGHVFLLDAFRKAVLEFAGIKLLIVGDGQLRESLERRAIDLQISEKVIFCGKRNDISQLLQIFDIFVLPSLTEAMPLALLEAMASKKPVIATKVGEIPEIISNGYSGLLVEPGDACAMADALVTLLRDKKKASLFAARSNEMLKKNYTSEQMTQKYLNIYELLCS